MTTVFDYSATADRGHPAPISFLNSLRIRLAARWAEKRQRRETAKLLDFVDPALRDLGVTHKDIFWATP